MIPSDFARERRIRSQKARSCPTSVMSVPCRVVTIFSAWLGGSISLDSVRDLIQHEGGPAAELASPGAMEALQAALSSGLMLVFWTVAAFAVAILLISWRVPDLRIEEEHRSG